MKKIALLSIAVFLNATTISELFDAIKTTPDYQLDEVMVKEMKINKQSVVNSLYPKVSIVGSVEHFNIYNSVIPITPTESAKLMATNSDLPFSQNIARIGVDFSMPLFIKSIYDNKNKMEKLLSATKYQSKIDFLKKEALIVGYVSKLNYLFSLKKALNKQYQSINTTLKALKVEVDVGRIPEFKLLRLKDSLNQIKIKLSNIKQNIDEIKSNIYKLTKIYIDKIEINSENIIEKGEFISLKPLKEKLKADEYDIKSKKDSFIPKIIFQIKANRSYAKAYNTENDISEDFASAGIYLSWDIFNKKNSSEIQKAKINFLKTKLTIAKTKKDLTAEILKINNLLNEVSNQIKLTKENIKLKEELLKGAKVAFELNRMSVDEYLKYEDDLAKATSDLASLKATKNSLKANKALIYGKNFKRIFK